LCATGGGSFIFNAIGLIFMSGLKPVTDGLGYSSLWRLAMFFPGAVATRIPVVVQIEPASAGIPSPEGVLTAPGPEQFSEATVIEFGTVKEVFFSSRLPLEAEDRVRLRNQDGSLDATAIVVAVRLDGRQAAVAARFTGTVHNWIIQPEGHSVTA
jgi:hypothetical protein